MLRLEKINLILNKGSNLEREILKDISLNIAEGEFVVILGGNGAGKSTLFNVISGYIKPIRGKIIIDQEDVTFKAHVKRAPLIAKVMQDPKVGTMENMSIEENMSFAYKRGKNRLFSKNSTAFRRDFFKEKLAVLGMNLENRLDELVSHLSGGQRQALSLIMAIMADAKILLLDEMTAALDPKMAERIMHIAHKIISEEKRTTLMITHHMAHALEYGDRILILSEGKIKKEFNKEQKNKMNMQDLTKEFLF